MLDLRKSGTTIMFQKQMSSQSIMILSGQTLNVIRSFEGRTMKDRQGDREAPKHSTFH